MTASNEGMPGPHEGLEPDDHHRMADVVRCKARAGREASTEASSLKFIFRIAGSDEAASGAWVEVLSASRRIAEAARSLVGNGSHRNMCAWVIARDRRRLGYLNFRFYHPTLEEN